MCKGRETLARMSRALVVVLSINASAKLSSASSVSTMLSLISKVSIELSFCCAFFPLTVTTSPFLRVSCSPGFNDIRELR